MVNIPKLCNEFHLYVQCTLVEGRCPLYDILKIDHSNFKVTALMVHIPKRNNRFIYRMLGSREMPLYGNL